MSVPPGQKLLTAEDLYAISASSPHRYDLVRGVLRVSEPVGDVHGEVALRIGAALLAFVRPRKLGRVMVETGYVLARGPDTVHGPDVSFVREREVLAPERRGRFLEGTPDLAVEVLSPGDRPTEVAGKVARYLAAGTALAWVVDPRARTVAVHTPTAGVRLLRGAEALDGAGVLPGFSLLLADVFDE